MNEMIGGAVVAARRTLPSSSLGLNPSHELRAVARQRFVPRSKVVVSVFYQGPDPCDLIAGYGPARATPTKCLDGPHAAMTMIVIGKPKCGLNMNCSETSYIMYVWIFGS